MNYQAAYNRLITYRQEHPAQGYTERHHIIMRSMGGSDDSTNLVVLTGREHWIAHLLLHKIHYNSQTVHACHMMAMRCEERGIAYIKNSRMYEKIRVECSKLTSIRNSQLQSGEGNSQYGTRWICNLELQENRKISKNEIIPDGWLLGRNAWNKIVKTTKPLTRSLTHRQNISKAMKIAKIGNKSLSNMIWINNGCENKVIPKSSDIPFGFIKGKLKRVVDVTVT